MTHRMASSHTHPARVARLAPDAALRPCPPSSSVISFAIVAVRKLVDLRGREIVRDGLPGAELVEQTLIRHRPRPDAALGANRPADRDRCRCQILGGEAEHPREEIAPAVARRRFHREGIAARPRARGHEASARRPGARYDVPVRQAGR